MKMTFRRLRSILMVCVASAASSSGVALAAEWHPTRPIQVVVPSAPGGGLDLVGRTLQTFVMQDKLSSQPFVVLNRPGGGGTVSLAYINLHASDNHFVSVQALPLVTNRLTGMSNVGADDVTPLALLLTEPVVFSVAADSPIKTGRDLLARLKSDPTSVSMAVSSTPGGQSHVAAAMVLKAIGVDPKKLSVVFFDSGGEAVTALMGGHVTVAVTPAGVVLGPSQGGKVRMIAIPSADRETGPLADVPTWKELGCDVNFTTWRVLVGPKNLTADQIAWWDDVLAKVTASPSWAAAVQRNLWTLDYKNSADTKVFLKNETTRISSILNDLGVGR